jgi:hypothetical protein
MSDPSTTEDTFEHLRCLSIVMVSSTQDRNRKQLARLVWGRSRKQQWLRNPLPKPLMGSGLMKGHHRVLEKAVELLLPQDEEVIQAFSPHA